MSIKPISKTQKRTWGLNDINIFPKWAPTLVQRMISGQTFGGGRRQCCLQRPLLGGLGQGWEGQRQGACESRSAVFHSLRPHGLHSPWNSPGKNTGVGSLSLLQGIFPTQGLNPGLPHCSGFFYQLSHKGTTCGGGARHVLDMAGPYVDLKLALDSYLPPSNKTEHGSSRKYNRKIWHVLW